MKRKEYLNYLKTKRWKLKRRKRIELTPFCNRCGNSKRLQCHHLTYKRLGRERMSDLSVNCHNCHKNIRMAKVDALKYLKEKKPGLYSEIYKSVL